MNEDEFLEQMKTLIIPDVKPGSHQLPVKVAIMNAQRSAALGVWLIAVPCDVFHLPDSARTPRNVTDNFPGASEEC